MGLLVHIRNRQRQCAITEREQGRTLTVTGIDKKKRGGKHVLQCVDGDTPIEVWLTSAELKKLQKLLKISSTGNAKARLVGETFHKFNRDFTVAGETVTL